MKKDTICWDCANACGKCNWTKDFTPVEGWEFIPGKNDSKIVTYCPEFVRDSYEFGQVRAAKKAEEFRRQRDKAKAELVQAKQKNDELEWHMMVHCTD